MTCLVLFCLELDAPHSCELEPGHRDGCVCHCSDCAERVPALSGAGTGARWDPAGA